MKRYINALFCVGLLMGASSLYAADEEPLSWMKQTSDIVLNVSDKLFDFRLILPLLTVASPFVCEANMPTMAQIMLILGHASWVRLALGVITGNANRLNSASDGLIVYLLMARAAAG